MLLFLCVCVVPSTEETSFLTTFYDLYFLYTIHSYTVDNGVILYVMDIRTIFLDSDFGHVVKTTKKPHPIFYPNYLCGFVFVKKCCSERNEERPIGKLCKISKDSDYFIDYIYFFKTEPQAAPFSKYIIFTNRLRSINLT